jgi:hypothetical protein
MTEKELRAIQERVNRASEGPWAQGTLETECLATRNGKGRPILRRTNGNTLPDELDMDFIAHAREDVPRLVAEVRRLKTRIKNRWGLR